MFARAPPPTVLVVYSVFWLVKIPLLLLQFTYFIVFVSSWSWLQFRLKGVTILFWLEYVRNPCIKPLSLTIIILWLNDLMICCFCNHVLRLFYRLWLNCDCFPHFVVPSSLFSQSFSWPTHVLPMSPCFPFARYGDGPIIAALSIVEEGDVKKIRMGHLAVIGANKVGENFTNDGGLNGLN